MLGQKTLMKFKDCVYASYPTGSRYICNPPPTNTDKDTVILVNGYYDWQKLLLNEGWEDGETDYENVGDFQSYRKGEENYIVTEDEEFYKNFVKATEGARALNLMDKKDRITLFQAVNAASMFVADNLNKEVKIIYLRDGAPF